MCWRLSEQAEVVELCLDQTELSVTESMLRPGLFGRMAEKSLRVQREGSKTMGL